MPMPSRTCIADQNPPATPRPLPAIAKGGGVVLQVGQRDGVHERLLRELDDDELVVGRARFAQVLVATKDVGGALGLLVVREHLGALGRRWAPGGARRRRPRTGRWCRSLSCPA
jgi:hypothetical protein